MFLHLERLPERLPHEPIRPQATLLRQLGFLLQQLLIVSVMSAIMPIFWLIYLPVLLVAGRPPNVCSFAQLRRYLRRAWTETPPPPGLSLLRRLRFTLEFLRIALTQPIPALAWRLDDLLYRRELATPLRAPLFEMSAARSGSTQLGHYLEDDPGVAAPSVLQSIAPYLWLWRLAAATLGRVVANDTIRERVLATLPPAFVQRHEADPFRMDTIEAPFFALHLNALGAALGPAMMRDEFLFGSRGEHNRALWERDFVAYVDGLGRKTLAFAGPGPDGAPRRLLLKGHFLAAGDALAQRWPDARFLTVVREPLARIQSGINFLAVAPEIGGFGAHPWPWVVQALVEGEVAYGELERVWYGGGDPRRCVVRFTDYVADLEGTMRRVYRECLDQPELPASVPRVHAPRTRTNYLVNRSLDELGVDVAALRERLRPYRDWMEGR